MTHSVYLRYRGNSSTIRTVLSLDCHQSRLNLFPNIAGVPAEQYGGSQRRARKCCPCIFHDPPVYGMMGSSNTYHNLVISQRSQCKLKCTAILLNSKLYNVLGGWWLGLFLYPLFLTPMLTRKLLYAYGRKARWAGVDRWRRACSAATRWWGGPRPLSLLLKRKRKPPQTGRSLEWSSREHMRSSYSCRVAM